MFKELKVIKLIVFVGMLILIISKIDFLDNIIEQIYTDKPSYYGDEKIEVYSSTSSFLSLNRTIPISDVSEKEITKISIDLTEQKANDNPVKNGLGYKNYTFLQLLNPGLYFIENKYPVIIKSKTKADITVVYPYANNILYEAYGNDNAFSQSIKNASLNRTASIDAYSKGLLPFFDYLNTNYSVNYIADIDLENFESFNQSNILILYGKLTCSTPKMNDNIKNFLQQGGNILLMSSYAFNNVCWYNSESNKIIMYNDTSKSMLSWKLYNQQPPEKTIGVSYIYASNTNDSILEIVTVNHAILKDIKNKSIPLNATLYNSPPIKWFNNSPIVDTDSIKFYKGDIIAYGKNNDKQINGIFVLQPDSTSGKIVSLGTEDWCLPENYQENSSIQQITKNSVNYLLK